MKARLTGMGAACLVSAVLTCALAGAAFADDAFDSSALPHAVPGSLPAETPALSVHDANEAPASPVALQTQSSDALPSSYSSVNAGYVTPVRSQGRFGLCWAFGAIAALESSLLAHGQVEAPVADADGGVVANAADALDLSERHLGYFTYHGATDPLGYTAGDDVRAFPDANSPDEAASDPYLEVGNNLGVTQHALAAWRGAVDEAAAPYDELEAAYRRYQGACYGISADSYSYDDFLADTALSPDDAYAKGSWHLTGTRQIALGDTGDVKRAVMGYGAVSFSLYLDDDYLNADTGAYYYYGGYTTNHIASIVGWDDEYDAGNFAWTYEDSDGNRQPIGKTKAPRRDGAWLVKNSWGAWWGNGGYCWVSYEDASLFGAPSKAFAFLAEPAMAHDNIYQHDGSCGTCWNYVASGGSIANVYEARGNAGGAEVLDAVMFSLEDVNVDYAVQVYLGMRDESDPTSGSPAFAEPVRGKSSYAGYYTVELPRAVPLAEGTRFSVVVTLSHANGERVGYSVDTSYGRGDRYGNASSPAHFTSAVHPHESFERDALGRGWDDLSTAGNDYGDEPWCAARLKALTRNVEADGLATVPFDEAQAALELGSEPLAYTGSALEPDVKVTYGDAVLVRDVDYRVSYHDNVAAGRAIAVVEPAGVYAGAARELEFAIAKAARNISAPDSISKTYGAKAFSLDARASGSGRISYTTSNPRVATVNSAGVVSVKGAGNARIMLACAADANYEAAPNVAVSVTVARAANTLSVSTKAVTVKASKLKRTSVKVARSRALTVKKARGKVTYAKAGGSSKVKVSRSGRLTLAKGLSKGTYRVRVKVSAAGTSDYAKRSRTVTVKVRVR